MTEQAIIQGCIKGKRKAQYALYERYKQDVFGTCLRYARDRAEAHDMMQESFVKIYRDLYQYRPIGPFGGWIRRVVINVALQHIRKRKQQIFSSDDIDTFGNSSQSNTDIIGDLNAKDLIKIVQQLPDGYRTVFNLYAIEGFSHQEISEQLGISVNTSKSQLSRAKAHLRGLLEKILA